MDSDGDTRRPSSPRSTTPRGVAESLRRQCLPGPPGAVRRRILRGQRAQDRADRPTHRRAPIHARRWRRRRQPMRERRSPKPVSSQTIIATVDGLGGRVKKGHGTAQLARSSWPSARPPRPRRDYALCGPRSTTRVKPSSGDIPRSLTVAPHLLVEDRVKASFWRLPIHLCSSR